MAALSNIAVTILTVLADDDQAVISTVRHETSVEWSAWVKTRGDARSKAGRFAVRIHTFRKLCRTGLIAKVRESQAFGIIYAEYELTDAGRAALEDI
jgi:repressor of nif and glnA expression